jgi:hypothetical protein
LDRVGELVEQVKAIVAGNPDKASLWRAYVALEYAVMDLKLRHNMEGEAPPEKPAKKAIYIAEARSMIARLNLSGDKRKLLRELRSCRDVVKALVAGYDRRSTTS